MMWYEAFDLGAAALMALGLLAVILVLTNHWWKDEEF